MPQNKNVLVSVLGLLFFAFGVAHLSQWNTTDQGAKSVKNLRRTIKMMPPIEVNISKLEDKTVEPGDIVTLIAKVKRTAVVGHVNWEWRAGPGVEFLDATTGHLNLDEAREEQTFQVRFKQVSDQNEMIHFSFSKIGDRPQLVGNSIYNSLKQDLINYETTQLLERQKIYHEEMDQNSMTVLSSEADAKEDGHNHDH